MNRLFVLAGALLYGSLCHSSQEYIQLGNFSNQSFTPRGGVAPDQSPAVLRPGVTVIDSEIPDRSEFQTLAADDGLQIAAETQITVTGHVKKMSNPIRNARGDMVQILDNASGVKVMFWQPQTAASTRTTITDENGNYEINLTNGFWRGEACGSGVGYSPNAWEVSLRDNKLVQMQEVSYAPPSITPNWLDVAMLENTASTSNAVSTFLKQRGEELTISGQGFGCNGSLVFDFHNSVDECGEINPVQYNHKLIIKSDIDFIGESHTDTKIKIRMPSLEDTGIGVAYQGDDIRRIAKMYYQKGNQRSNAIFVGEFIREAFAAGSAACESGLPERINGDGRLTDITGELENLGEVRTGVFTGGFDFTSGFGGFAGTPLFMMTDTVVNTGPTATASGTAVQTVGSAVMTDLDIAIEVDLDFEVETGNLNVNLRN